MCKAKNLPMACRRGNGSCLGLRGGDVSKQQASKWTLRGIPRSWTPDMTEKWLHDQKFTDVKHIQPPRTVGGLWTVVNSALALDSAATTYTDASQVQQFAVHPVQQIRQAEEVWLQQWSADPAVHSAEHLDNLRNFLGCTTKLAHFSVAGSMDYSRFTTCCSDNRREGCWARQLDK
jgi:hypothetical protein